MWVKVYIKVWSETDLDGNITPLALEWIDGQRFEIDKILEKRVAVPKGVDIADTSVRYTVMLYGQRRFLYREEKTNRWFVVMKK